MNHTRVALQQYLYLSALYYKVFQRPTLDHRPHRWITVRIGGRGVYTYEGRGGAKFARRNDYTMPDMLIQWVSLSDWRYEP